MTIGVMAIAMGMSLAVIGLDRLGFTAPHGHECALITSIDFSGALTQGPTVGRIARSLGLIAVISSGVRH